MERPTFSGLNYQHSGECYILTNNEEVEIIAFVLDIINHPGYDKKFGYKGR